MKSTNIDDLNEVVFTLNPQTASDSFVRYCYIANLLWLTMSENQQKAFIKEMKKQIVRKGL